MIEKALNAFVTAAVMETQSVGFVGSRDETLSGKYMTLVRLRLR
jgi:hypothetical protein